MQEFLGYNFSAMKYRLAALLVLHALVLMGNAQISTNSGQSSNKHTQTNQAPASRPPTAQDQIRPRHDGKPDQPEATPNQQPRPSVTINAVPRIDVKRDWMDGATLIVAILLVLVGGATGWVIWYQAVQTRVAATAAEKSAAATEANTQAFRESERAWIVEEIRFPDHIPTQSEMKGGILSVDFVFKNVGKQPAFVRIVSISFLFLERAPAR
jgi:hypothetical protein